MCNVYRVLALSTLVAVTLTACKQDPDIGYIELRTIPAVTAVQQPTFYLDMVKLEPVKKGVAVLRQRVGAIKLATEGGMGTPALLCEVVVKKNRITAVTVPMSHGSRRQGQARAQLRELAARGASLTDCYP